MNHYKFSLITLALFFAQLSYGQQDSTKTISSFNGKIGFTNNGFSIIPTFSLNSPAAIMNFSWRKNRFSFNPDIRLIPDLSRGGMLFWFRYQVIEQKKFSLRLSVHPAFTLVKRSVNDNGASTEITEVLRFIASEIVPSFQINPNWSISAVYLHGNGLQNHGPQLTQVLFLNTSISNIKVGGDFRFQIIPSLYFLSTDGSTGKYFSATGILSNKNTSFTLQSTINQTFESNIVGNRDFMWNVMVAYNFSKDFNSIK